MNSSHSTCLFPIRCCCLSAAMIWCVCLLAGSSLGQDATDPIDFDRQIRPILSDRCYFCHGPDQANREAGLRLDMAEDALGVIEPGMPDDSELLRRIESDDPDEQMPPPKSKLAVTDEEKQLIRKWIKQGATWKKHWAFQPRQQPAVPNVKQADQVVNAIDAFLLRDLESKQLSFSPLAKKERLIRRATFDLTGLPPTLQEVEQFLQDDSPEAYERLLDRLLESPHYGQRMASYWLDVARYSDTYGYQVDRDRFVWPWRDWVIRAFNRNQPYDQFIVEQLAGDLLEDPTQDQILATTFNRLHPQKVEGGSVEEEFRVEYVADRTQTFGTAFLGLTLECARCHDHKFDPISQQEYYQLFAYFNNIDESGLYSYFTSSVPTPTLTLLDDGQRSKLVELRQALKQSNDNRPSLEADEAALAAMKIEAPGDAIETVDFAKVGIGGNQRVEDERGQPAVKLTGDDAVNLKSGNFRRFQPFTISIRIHTPDVKDRAVIFHRSRAWTDAGSRGYQLLIEEGRLSASLIHFWPGDAMRVRTKKPIATNRWMDVAVVYDGSSKAAGLQIFVDGERQELDVVRDNLTRQITGGGGDNLAIGQRFRDRGFTDGQVSTMSVFDRQLSDLEIARLHRVDTSAEEKKNVDQRQLDRRRQHFELTQSEAFAEHRAKVQNARKALCDYQDRLPAIMVMREQPEPRPAFVLERGLYDSPRQAVVSQTPATLPPMESELPNNRLGLARWLVQGDHPLTSRVAVNQLWQLIFGQGLVRTPEDFGRQGALPTHPELLDWLSNDFVDSGWDVKRLLKQMMMSRAYRQSSVTTDQLLRLDPENQWLARAPAYRLTAEMLRDNALAVSGLLVDRIGGAPVRPYELAASFKPSKPDKGAGLYRRSVYTYWKRTGPAPVMMALDAAKRDVCRVKREQTSSPLQALAMLNGPQFVEASRALATKLINQHGLDAPQTILKDMFGLLTSRQPLDSELKVIEALFERQRDYFADQPDALKAYLETGEYRPALSEELQKIQSWEAQLAAFAAVANALLNHDECVTKR